MTRIVIPTTPVDREALLVSAALKTRGVDCTIWYTSDYPRDLHHTVRFGKRTQVSFSPEIDGPRDWNYDVCWLRDLYPPFPDMAEIHPDDQEFVLRVNRQYYFSQWNFLADATTSSTRIFWVNHLEAARRAESKLLQLHLAQAAGFTVPDTIISNDPFEIRKFVAEATSGAVRKSLVPHHWYEGDVCISNKTTRISPVSLPSDAVLAIHAEVYQVEVDKQYEVRVVFFGDTYLALQIAPGPERSSKTIDWRIFHHRSLAGQDSIELPSCVRDSCKQLMKDLGIVSASFDLAIDRNGDYHFLEVNQGGLFLWMEDSGLPVLQAFIDFLVSGDPEFRWKPPGGEIATVSTIRETKAYNDLRSNENSHLIPPRQMGLTVAASSQ